MRTTQKNGQRRRRLSHWLFGGLAVIVLGALAAAFSLSSGGRGLTGEPTIPRGAPLASWNENGQGGKYLLQIVEGDAPPSMAKLFGVVASDTTCEPDPRGLSHCHNAINLANGTRITVIDTHRMSRTPCLRPGNVVWLTSLNPSWVMATRSY
jgi:hypothetical protein